MKKHLILAGGGHAHMVALSNISKIIEKGHSVSVIGPSEYHYYSGMGPGMLGKTYSPREIRFATRRLVEKQGGTFLLDSINRIDAVRKTVFMESGATCEYDVLSLNIGSYVENDFRITGRANIFSVKPIEKLIGLQERLLDILTGPTKQIAVIGGGPSAVEISGNIMHLARDHCRSVPEIKILAGHRLMGRFPAQVRQRVVKYLVKQQIQILEKNRVTEISDRGVTSNTGHVHDCDLIVIATGVKPSPIIKNSGLPCGPDGGLQVNQYLQCNKHPEIFGGGDCIHFEPRPLDKVGVYAVRQNPVLYHNLTAALEGKELFPFEPGGDYLLVFNMGGGIGVLKKKGITMGGRLAFIIKDYIDRKFMNKFQALE